MTAANPNLHAAVAEDPILGLSAFELAQKIHARELTSVEVTQAFLDRIAAIDEDIHAFLHVGADEALDAARKVDESLDAGEEPASALAGVPLALKDVFMTLITLNCLLEIAVAVLVAVGVCRPLLRLEKK